MRRKHGVFSDLDIYFDAVEWWRLFPACVRLPAVAMFMPTPQRMNWHFVFWMTILMRKSSGTKKIQIPNFRNESRNIGQQSSVILSLRGNNKCLSTWLVANFPASWFRHRRRISFEWQDLSFRFHSKALLLLVREDRRCFNGENRVNDLPSWG